MVGKMFLENVHPVYGAGTRTQDLLIMSTLPEPLYRRQAYE